MTTLDLHAPEATAAESRRPLFAGLGQLWAAYRRRREERRTLIELSQLDAYLLRDMGIEPLDVYDALNGRRRSVLLSPVRRTIDRA